MTVLLEASESRRLDEVIHNGQMNYNIDGNIVSLDANEGIFVNSRHIHYGYSDHKECEFLCVVLDPSVLFINETIKENCILPLLNNPEFPYVLLSKEDWHQEILNYLSGIHNIENNLDILELQSKMLEIWKLLYQNMPFFSNEVSLGNHNLDSMRLMLNYIRNNYSAKITLNDIADSGKVSVSTCCALFNIYLNISPMNFTRDHRIKISMNLLENSNESMTEIAYKCGFTNSSYFSETFKQLNGISPKEYRHLKQTR